MKFIQSPLLLSHSEIIHFQTTRPGGVSTSPYNTFNLSYWTGDDPQTVLQNRQRLADAVGLPLSHFVIARQTHGANVRVVTLSEQGSGVYFENKEALPDTDALITDLPDTVLCISTADCIPVLFYDPYKKVIAAAHAGWKGTAQRIAVQTVERMVYHYGCKREDILAGILVGAGLCCYEVDEKVAAALRRTCSCGASCADVLRADGAGKYHVDLKNINRLQLVGAGLLPQHIEVSPECTICSSDLYFSFRKSDGIHFGQSLTGIAMRGVASGR